MNNKIVFLIPYPLEEAPSQRFRFEQYLDILRAQGYHIWLQSFLAKGHGRTFYAKGNIGGKTLVLMFGFFRRLAGIRKVAKADFVFIHREVTPIGPPIFEWIIARIFKKRIIYDFDDAIWMTDRVKESRIIKTLKFRSKTKAICRWAYKVSCGNEYLAVFARQFASRVFIIPTTVDTDLHIPKEGNSGRTIVGWTGSHSTLKYLEKIEPVLIELTTAFPKIEIMVIADRPPVFSKIQCTFHTWNAATEIEDLQNFDIGMMPLPDDEWSKGKCGFKALQYMALGIPAVASAVGENMKIIQHGVNGFLVSSEEEWLNCLSMLLRDPALCKRIGEAGRKRVLDHYSVVSNRSAFLNLFT